MTMTDEPLSEETVDQLEQLRAEVEEWKNVALRARADFDNLQRRAALREQELLNYAAEHTISKMLPILDDLHMAVESSKNATDVESIRSGLELIFTKAVGIFSSVGLTPIEGGEGQPFNVDYHESLMHMPSADVPEGHVVQVVQRGYLLNDKVIRHSKVITSAGAE
jgi:molecular chaperone GrpE